MSRRALIAGNWKMHHNQVASRAWCEKFREVAKETGLPSPDQLELAIAAPFTSIATFSEAAADLPISIGAQNLHWETSGAFTGEISSGMLVELGCQFVLIGHSERRHVFGESDERIARKMAAAREAGILPYLCVGETEQQRDSGRTEITIERQLQAGLGQVTIASADELVIAYEPVWAIGTGRTATASQAQQAHHFLRAILASITSPQIAAATRILYGGSVKPSNAGELALMDDVDGFLVGGASLDAASLQAIARGFAAPES